MELLKSFLAYYKPYKKIFVWDMICAIVVSVIDLAFPQILNILVNGLFLESPAEILRMIVWVACGLVVMYLVRYGCQYYITSWGHIMGAHMESDMRQDLFNHMQRLSFSYYDKNNTGDMMSKIVSDLFDISELAHHGPENYVISALKIIGSFVLLLMINVPMTLILLAVTVTMILFSLSKNKKMQRVFTDNRKKIAGVNSQVQDSLAGIRVVKSFANEDWEREKFRESNDLFLESKKDSYHVMANFHAGNTFFTGMLYATVLVAGGLFIANGTLKVTELAIYALYIGIFVNPIDVLINFTEQFQKGFAGFKRFKEVVDTEPEIVDRPDARPLEDVQGNIVYSHVSFHYDDDSTNVLEDVTLGIPAGKTVALVGPSGGGKTTFCSLLPRFYDVAEGSVSIDGTDVRSATLKSLRSAMGIVQQDVYMFGGTVRDNIAYGKLDATDGEIVEAAKQANIHEFIVSLPEGYNTNVGERGARLSGGQKQRIAIARVFLKNPKILILDEATSALDNESELHIQDALEKLSVGRTTIVIAHRLSTIRNADEIVVMNEKGIVERGAHAELMEKNGLYAKYYNMQFEGLND
ncbi:ABC transporter ATP-binding protein/permease [Christensenellaceae bacterium OttesenSCG-928-K19]|nr:ABC transporter ATP-binding protein/permease [Christensenellaceae bacterium OttesenSCG-928-K19]